MRAAHHHPDEDTLLAFGAGTLAPGAALVVEAHAEGCRVCAATLRFLESVGGALIATLPAEALSEGSFDRVMHRLHAVSTAAGTPRAAGPAAPAALASRKVGPWRWIGPGLWKADVAGGGAAHERVFLLRGKPGARIPRHGHLGAERYAVLQGGFVLGEEHYDQGDYGEAERGDRHAVTVAPGADCVCLFANDDAIEFEGVTRWWMSIWPAANNMTKRRPSL